MTLCTVRYPLTHVTADYSGLAESLLYVSTVLSSMVEDLSVGIRHGHKALGMSPPVRLQKPHTQAIHEQMDSVCRESRSVCSRDPGNHDLVIGGLGLGRTGWGHSQNSMGTPSRRRQHVGHRLATADNHSDTCCAAVPCSYTCSARGIFGHHATDRPETGLEAGSGCASCHAPSQGLSLRVPRPPGRQ